MRPAAGQRERAPGTAPLAGRGSRAVRRVVLWLCRLTVRIFFRRVEVVGVSNVPASGPVIFVLNHPNGLIDPLFAMALAPRPVSFLAKEPLFRTPLVSYFVRAFDSLPVYRTEDRADPAQNRQTLEAASDLLVRGGAIALFPEGTTHNRPQLQPLKSGAARIALGAQALLAARGAAAAVQVVPVGLHYDAKGTFRSGAVLIYGPPVDIEEVALDGSGQPPRQAVRALTGRLDAALRALTVNADDDELIALAATAARLLAQRSGMRRHAGPLHRRFDLMQRILERHAQLSSTAPGEVAALVQRLREYRATEASHGLEGSGALELRLRHAAWYLLRTLLVLAVLSPLVLLGLVENYLPYRLVGPWARRVARGEEAVLSTTKVLAGMILFPAVWLALSLAAGVFLGWKWAAVHLLVAPVAAWSALWVLDRVESIRWGAILLWSSRVRPDRHASLVAEREAITEALLRAASRDP